MTLKLLLILLLLTTLLIRVATFNFNPILPKTLTINSFNKYSKSFYTAKANNFNLSFSYKGNLHPQDVISYNSYTYNNVYNSYTLNNIKVINNNPKGFSRFKKNLYFFKQSLLKRLNLIIKGKAYELSSGMLFGEKSALAKNFKNDLIKVGLIHIVVVSGFNISLVGLLILNFFKKLGQIAYALSFLGIVLYSILVGLEPPVLRALIMGSIVIIARLKGEESNQIYLLFITGCIMVFLNPLILTSISFQLSFMATLGILTFTPIFDSIFPKILSDLSASISAQLMVLPILAYNFGQVSVISPFANLLTLWAVPIITITSGILLLISFISTKIAFLLSFLVTIPSFVIEKVASNLSLLNFASVAVKMDAQEAIVCYFAVFFFYLFYVFSLSRQ